MTRMLTPQQARALVGGYICAERAIENISVGSQYLLLDVNEQPGTFTVRRHPPDQGPRGDETFRLGALDYFVAESEWRTDSAK